MFIPQLAPGHLNAHTWCSFSVSCSTTMLPELFNGILPNKYLH